MIEIDEFVNELIDNGYGDIAFYLIISDEFSKHVNLIVNSNDDNLNNPELDLVDNTMTELYMDCGYGLYIYDLFKCRNIEIDKFWDRDFNIGLLDLINLKMFNRMRFRYIPEVLPFIIVE